MASPVYMEWPAVSTKIPAKMYRELRKQLIDDGIPLNAFLITCIHAYIKGEIILEPNPLLGGKTPSLIKMGDPDVYRSIMKDQGGALLNPLPITEKDL